MSNRRLALVMCLVGFWASCAWGEIYTVPLDGLKGVYSSGDLGPWDKMIAVDMGLQFARIDSVALDVKGTTAPALERIWIFPGSPGEIGEVLWPFNFFIYSPDAPGKRGDAEVHYDGAFDIQVSFAPRFTPDWSFLKSGRAELQCQLEPPESAQIYAAQQIVPFLLGVENATLVIEGQAVPEPAEVLGVAAWGLMLISRRA